MEKLSDIFEEPIPGEWGTEVDNTGIGIPVLRTTNFTNDGTISFDNVVYRKINLENRENKILRYGDIVIEKSGGSPQQPVGRVVFFDSNSPQTIICNNFTAILRLKKNYNPTYIFHLMQFLYDSRRMLKFQNQTTGIANLKLNDYLENIDVNIPGIEEQNHCTDVLAYCRNMIVHSHQLLAKLDTFVKSRFIEMFGDPISNSHNLPDEALGDVCVLKAGITTSPKELKEQEDDEYNVPCYGGNGIRGFVKTASYHGEYPIIGRQGALCGNVQFARGDFHATEHAVLVTPKITFNPLWLYVTLREMNLNRFQTGAAQPGLAVKTLNAVRIITPPITLQNQFADFVAQADKSKLAIRKLLEKQELLRAALMQEYFG